MKKEKNDVESEGNETDDRVTRTDKTIEYCNQESNNQDVINANVKDGVHVYKRK